MKSLASTFVVLQVLALTCTSISRIRYVKPGNVSSSSCPGQPCLTLEQYTEHTLAYFTVGSTFVFLPGNHSVKSSINLSNVSDITLRGTEYNSSATIVCTVDFTMVCQSVSNLSIEWLAFDMTKNQSHAVVFNVSTGIFISNCIFKGSVKIGQTTARALYATKSDITIFRTVFERNKGSNILLQRRLFSSF